MNYQYDPMPSILFDICYPIGKKDKLIGRVNTTSDPNFFINKHALRLVIEFNLIKLHIHISIFPCVILYLSSPSSPKSNPQPLSKPILSYYSLCPFFLITPPYTCATCLSLIFSISFPFKTLLLPFSKQIPLSSHYVLNIVTFLFTFFAYLCSCCATKAQNNCWTTTLVIVKQR